jgi:hypothetical protein
MRSHTANLQAVVTHITKFIENIATFVTNTTMLSMNMTTLVMNMKTFIEIAIKRWVHSGQILAVQLLPTGLQAEVQCRTAALIDKFRLADPGD